MFQLLNKKNILDTLKLKILKVHFEEGRNVEPINLANGSPEVLEEEIELDEREVLDFGGSGRLFLVTWTVGIEPSTKVEEMKHKGHLSFTFTVFFAKIASQNVHSTNSGKVNGWKV